MFANNRIDIRANHGRNRAVITGLNDGVPSYFVITASSLTINIVRTFAGTNVLIPHSIDVVDVGGRSVTRCVSPPLAACTVSRATLTEGTLLVLSRSVDFGSSVAYRAVLSAGLITHRDFIPTGRW